MTAEEFRQLWCEIWRFSALGKPEDAAWYIGEVLLAVRDGAEGEAGDYVRRIGGLNGQQEFVFNWLSSTGLIVSEVSPRMGSLSELGNRALEAIEQGVYLEVFMD